MKKTLKPGTVEYTFDRLDILPIDDVYPHEETKPSEVFSIRGAINRIDPYTHRRMSPFPIMVTPWEVDGRKKYVVLDGMHRYQAVKEKKSPHVFAYSVEYTSDNIRLRGWDAIVTQKIDWTGIKAATLEDIGELLDNEYAAFPAEFVSLGKKGIREFQRMMDDQVQPGKNDYVREHPFFVVFPDGEGVTLKKKDGGRFNLYETIQALADFDEVLERYLKKTGDIGLKHIRFSADDATEEDFEYFREKAQAELVVIRTRFSKEEVCRIALEKKLLPKKTTRHIFRDRPLVRIPMDILEEENNDPGVNRRKAFDFIHQNFRPRFYPESIHDFEDVYVPFDISARFRQDERNKIQAIQSDRKLAFAREWVSPDKLVIGVPGPVEFSHPLAPIGITEIVGHRSEEFKELYLRTSQALRWLFDPDNTLMAEGLRYESLIISGPATLGMEISSVAAVRPKRKIVHIVAGAFGERWNKISRSHGIETATIKIDPGKGLQQDDHDRLSTLLDEGTFDAVSLVHNETSTGVIYPLEDICRVIREYEKKSGEKVLFLVDAASSLGGADIPCKKHIDFLVGSTEKCLAVYPGISSLIVSPSAIARSVQNGRKTEGFIYNFQRLLENHYKGLTLTTPAIPQIIMTLRTIQFIHGFVTADGRYFPGEGLANRYARYERLAEFTREWAGKMGFEPFSGAGNHSPTVTAVIPKGFRGGIITKRLKKYYNIDLSPGHRDLSVEMLRFPHMGEMSLEIQRSILEKVTNAIAEIYHYDKSIYDNPDAGRPFEEHIKDALDYLGFPE